MCTHKHVHNLIKTHEKGKKLQESNILKYLHNIKNSYILDQIKRII